MHSMQSVVIKTVVARLERGEDLYVALTKLAREYDVHSGCFQVIGAVSSAKLGIFENGKYEWVRHSSTLEIASCLGNVALKDGTPFIHCHAVLTDHKGLSLGGHVGEGCIIDPTGEVHLQIFADTVSRKLDEATGLFVLDI